MWVRLREEGGKQHEMHGHHTLEAYLDAYIEGTGTGADSKGATVSYHSARYRAAQYHLPAPSECVRDGDAPAGRSRPRCEGWQPHISRDGITAYLKNGGTLENAAAMANHASTRTTQLYDRRRDDITSDEVERIRV
jgi:hypothetical protein